VIGRHLTTDGSALLQVGPDDQAERVAGLAAAYGLRSVDVREFARGALVRLDRAQEQAQEQTQRPS
jgi:hypothetical protein